MSRERVDETECEPKADQDDERSEQLAPRRILTSHEPSGEDPDDRHEQGEGSDRRRWVARHQPVPRAVAEERRDEDDVGEGGDPGRIERSCSDPPTRRAFEDQR